MERSHGPRVIAAAVVALLPRVALGEPPDSTAEGEPAADSAPAMAPDQTVEPPADAPPAAEAPPRTNGRVSYVLVPAPEELRYREGQEIPAGYELSVRPRLGPVIAGGVMTLLAWTLAVGFADEADFRNHSGWVLVPVAGPWLALAAGARDQCHVDCTAPDVRTALVLDGLVQTVGAVLLTYGLTSPVKRLVRKEPAVVALLTGVGHGGYGLGLLGAF